MIIFKIIGVLLLIIIILLIAAICIPVYVGIKYDASVTLEIRYLLVRFRRTFGDKNEEVQDKVKCEHKKITVFDKILSSATKFIKRSWRSVKAFCSRSADLIKRILNKLSKSIKIKFKIKVKSKNQKKRKSTKKKKTSKTKSTDQNLFDSLKEERGFWGAVNFFVDLGKMFGGGLVKMYRGIAANKFVLKVKVVGEDASDTAVKYGELCSAAFPALSFLLSNMRRYNQNIEITPDFNSGEGSIYFDGEFMVFPVLIIVHALGAVMKFAWKQIKIVFNFQNKK